MNIEHRTLNIEFGILSNLKQLSETILRHMTRLSLSTLNSQLKGSSQAAVRYSLFRGLYLDHVFSVIGFLTSEPLKTEPLNQVIETRNLNNAGK